MKYAADFRAIARAALRGKWFIAVMVTLVATIPLTLGIGSLWLNPYSNVSEAAFYREISGTGFSSPPENGGF